MAAHPRVSQLKYESRRPNLKITIPPNRTVSAPILLRRQQAVVSDTTARRPDMCESCCGHISVGDRVTKVTSFGAVALAAGALPADVESIIAENLNQKPTIHHSECAKMNGAYKTRSGRVSQKPVMLADEEFIGGSGFVGCDHYDHSYDGRDLLFDTNRIRSYGVDLTGFVVEDNQPVSPRILDSEDEGEWESGDETEEESECESWD